MAPEASATLHAAQPGAPATAPGTAAAPSEDPLHALLLRGAARPPARAFVRSWRDAAAAEACAAALLRETLHREANGWPEAADTLWPDVARAWQRVTRRAGATTDAARPPVLATALPRVHAALHARAMAEGPAPHAARHLDALAALAREYDSPGNASLLRHARLTAARALRDAGQHDDSLNQYLGVLATMPADAARLHLAAEADAVAAKSLDAADLASTEWSAKLDRVRLLCEHEPRDFTALRLWAKAECALGVTEIRERDAFNDGGVRFARAAILDALTDQPEQLLESTRTALAKQAEAVAAVAAQPGVHLNARGLRLRMEVGRGLTDADGFAASETGQTLRARVSAAIDAQLLDRLGLSADDPTAPAAARALVVRLASAEGADARTLAADLCAGHPALSSTPWDAVVELRSRFERVTPALLAELLPPPAPIAADDDVAATLRRTDAAIVALAGAGARRPGPIDAWVALPWLASAQGRVFQGLAVLGLLLALGAGAAHAWYGWHGAQRDAAWAGFEAATAANDADGVFAASRRFFAHLPSGVHDGRLEPLLEAYRRHLLAGIVAATRTGDADRVAALAADAARLDVDAPTR